MIRRAHLRLPRRHRRNRLRHTGRMCPAMIRAAAWQYAGARIQFALRHARSTMLFHCRLLVAQNFFDVVRERSGLIRICNRVTKLNDFRRRPEALTIEPPIVGRELGVCGAKFRHGESVSFCRRHRCFVSHVRSFLRRRDPARPGSRPGLWIGRRSRGPFRLPGDMIPCRWWRRSRQPAFCRRLSKACAFQPAASTR